jgi:hypothetical protein
LSKKKRVINEAAPSLTDLIKGNLENPVDQEDTMKQVNTFVMMMCDILLGDIYPFDAQHVQIKKETNRLTYNLSPELPEVKDSEQKQDLIRKYKVLLQFNFDTKKLILQMGNMSKNSKSIDLEIDKQPFLDYLGTSTDLKNDPKVKDYITTFNDEIKALFDAVKEMK